MDEEDPVLAPPDGWFGERYEIIKPLRQGAMGQVFLAKQKDLGRRVVLKALPTDFVADEKLSQRFLLEMKVMSVLEHPNTVRLYDFGRTTTGEYYISMEYIDGVDVQTEVAQSGPMHPARVVKLGLQVARALHAAHAEGVIHRDLKPENIMIRDLYGEKDVAKVLDFGIAKYEPQSFDEDASADAAGNVRRPSRLTARGMVVGTPQYVSPEQAVADPIDARSDIYSLGCVLYFATCGQPPFDHENIMTVLYNHINTVPPSPAELVNTPQPLSDVIMKCLEKRAEHRIQTAAEVAQALLRARQMFGAPGTPPAGAPAPIAASRPPLAVAATEVHTPVPHGYAASPDPAAEPSDTGYPLSPSREKVVSGEGGSAYDLAVGDTGSASPGRSGDNGYRAPAPTGDRHPLARPSFVRVGAAEKPSRSKNLALWLLVAAVVVAVVAFAVSSASDGSPTTSLKEKPSVPEALQPYVDRCNKGQAAGCLDAAKAFRLGDGVKADPDAAARYVSVALKDFSSKCDSGGAYFCFALGNMFSADAAVPLDLTRASKYYMRACELGYEDACDLK